MSGITLDNLRSLDANKSYYIANSTGQIKEAGLWQKFKCFVGVGDGREHAGDVLRVVREVAVHLDDVRGAQREGPCEPRHVGAAQPLLLHAVQDGDAGVPRTEAVDDRARPVRRVVVEEE